MFIELKLSNYRSIYSEQIFSFVASQDKRHPGNLIPMKGFRLLKGAAMFGPNAAGKSNLVKAIRFMRKFVTESATKMNEGDRISGAVPFRLAKATIKMPSRFEATFIVEETIYTYSFSATSEQVYDEWLKVRSLGAESETIWFERHYEETANKTTWTFAGPLKKEGDILKARTRPNALVLSLGPRENIEPLKIPFRYFREQIRVFDLSQSTEMLQMRTADRCSKDGLFQRKVIELVRDADIGIDDFRVEYDTTYDLPDIDERAPDEIKAVFSALRDVALTAPRQRIRTLHRGVEDDIIEFDFDHEESKGTQRFFSIVGPFIDALETGAFVVVDELDCSMHPLLTRKLLELFQSPKVNTKGAQILFTTHDPALFDQELFRRDQVWLVEKRRGASEFFSLQDIEPKPRNTEAFLRNYLAGRYGGTPQLGRSFEDLELVGNK